MKVLIFSDLHIHPHKNLKTRLQNCLSVLEWVFETAKSENIKHIIFCGDLFHDREKIDVYTYQKTFEVFKKYLLDDYLNIQFYCLLGNHDLWYFEKTDISSVYPLEAIAGFTVISKPCTLDIAGHPLSFLPYTHDPIRDLKEIKNEHKHKILFGHIAVDGAILNTLHGTEAEVEIEHDGEMVKVTADIFNDWDQVFLGHYHAKQQLNNCVEYVGSPLQLSFGEAFQHKEKIVLDLKNYSKEYIRNNFSPKHLIVTEDTVNKHKLKDNFVKVKVQDLAASNIVELRKSLTKHGMATLEIKPQKRKVEEELGMLVGAKSILNQQDGMLKSYIEAKKKTGSLGDLDEAETLRIGKWICETDADKILETIK